MKTHKRKKNSRLRGSKTAGWGFRQKHKGHGNKGGVGMAGTGKRGDHKKQVARSLDPKGKGRYFGKQGVTSRGTKRRKDNMINLRDIKANFFKKDGEKLDFAKHKILGVGEGFKATITAKAATQSAIKKMKEAGGEIILPTVKHVKQYVKKDSKKEELDEQGSDNKK